MTWSGVNDDGHQAVKLALTSDDGEEARPFQMRCQKNISFLTSNAEDLGIEYVLSWLFAIVLAPVSKKPMPVYNSALETLNPMVCLPGFQTPRGCLAVCLLPSLNNENGSKKMGCRCRATLAE